MCDVSNDHSHFLFVWFIICILYLYFWYFLYCCDLYISFRGYDNLFIRSSAYEECIDNLCFRFAIGLYFFMYSMVLYNFYIGNLGSIVYYHTLLYLLSSLLHLSFARVPIWNLLELLLFVDQWSYWEHVFVGRKSGAISVIL